MSLQSINIITEAESQAEQKLANAREYARAQLNDANAKGREISKKSKLDAQVECSRLMEQAEALAAVQAQAELDKAAVACRGAEALAQSRLDEASRLIVERIVSS